ncbi:MAG: BrnT family toxin [Bryobacteraceae bacterium]
MDFTWNPAKAASNIRKHGVGFREASTVLDDPLSITFPDSEHSGTEQRFLTLGSSAHSRLLVVAHTEEGSTIRIISARKSTRRERNFYEESRSH